MELEACCFWWQARGRASQGFSPDFAVHTHAVDAHGMGDDGARTAASAGAGLRRGGGDAEVVGWDGMSWEEVRVGIMSWVGTCELS